MNVARALGLTLDVWQRGVVTTAGELLPTGRFAYPIVVLVVPRRAGKTLLALLHALGLLTSAPGRRGWYTLHRREIGAALWRDELFPMLDGSRLAPLLSLRRSNGSESVSVRRFGSTLRLFAPSGEALRSQNADVVIVDEAREFELAAGEALEAAVRPAQARRPARQLWIVSSAGGPESTWLRRYRDLGRAAVETDRRDGIAYFEWAAPTGLDWRSPDTWRLGHPTLAAGTIDVEAIAADLDTMRPELFQMEYLGWWIDEGDGAAIVVDPARWSAAGSDLTLGDCDELVICPDVAPDRSSAAVAVAGRAGARVHVECVAVGPGATWARQTTVELAARWRRARVVVDTYGPAGNLAELLRPALAGRLDELGTGDAARHAATFLDQLRDGRLSHRSQPELSTIVDGRARRYGVDGWLWDRRTVGPQVTAATYAAGAVDLRPPDPPPLVVSAR